MDIIQQLVQDIDAGIIESERQYPRVYLGLSQIGRACSRSVFLDWRFAKFYMFPPRIYRIFDRGNREEDRFVSWLRGAGYTVLDRDPETRKQFSFVKHHGHVKGHVDGYILIAGEWLLLEFKTHSNKSFSSVKRANNIEVSKSDHYFQMQSYMEESGLKRGVYCAINKDNDALHFELVVRDKRAVAWAEERAIGLLTATRIPDVIVNDPDYWVCTMCIYKRICFMEEPVNRSCRLCEHSEMGEEGTWICTVSTSRVLRLNEQMVGCPKWKCI